MGFKHKCFAFRQPTMYCLPFIKANYSSEIKVIWDSANVTDTAHDISVPAINIHKKETFIADI
jgi:hypothetical protein